MIEYFELNKIAQKTKNDDILCLYEHKEIVKNPRHYLYQNISFHFVWMSKGKTWQFRKQNQTINRMYFMNSKANEMFYLKLLLVNKKDCISFENLKIVFIQIENVDKMIVIVSHVCDNFKNACVVLNFTNNNDE